MNTLILEANQFKHTDLAELNERQQQHIKSVLKLKEGDHLHVGALNGKLGHAELCEKNNKLFLRNINLSVCPPAQLNIILILALPRPQMLKRILQTVAIFGVKELVLIQTQRVEKSFWQSPTVTDHAIREQLILGLEQAKATQLPKISKFQRFRPFIEDDCPSLTQTSERFIAHPGSFPMIPSNKREQDLSLAIGPEGGFSEYEVGKFMDLRFSPVQIGERILKVETAVTAILGRFI